MTQPWPKRGLSPLLTVQRAAEAVAFYIEAFGARELFRLVDPSDGRLGHVELAFGDQLIMLADEYREAGALSPDSLNGTSVRMNLMVDDVEASVARAVACGAELLRPIETQFYGDKAGNVRDPFGYIWMLSQPVEEVSPEEMQRRWDAIVTG